ncbi:MAG: D-sedoheptulose 7-phosphate isomerase [Chloroherpetonaceae bacterium]|nr:D-sedoheptulose 7-phosphate isomerase [Chloroherpetonaceae bacterium]MCS7210615.1 D-sedoheptulose 7-phosphate isomerase [Chloroherpetonaceae bacterium]MDW8020473.1 D-sedoheptulose 7-phosphate isomerase [Chloroherpetonaceae bacterium]MDW8465344.1 D-sedoheptulose 7-phosphate isomerase [Chloroherpetonaceae bacterium]
MLDTVLDRKTLQLAYIRETLEYSAELKRRLARENAEEIFRMAECITEAFKRGNKLLICGNGGSAADAQHIATEFTIRYRSTVNRPAMPAIALTTDSSALTGGANDLGYDNVFARLVEAWGKPGDVLLGISTSGNSESVIRAIKYAKEHSLSTLALLGNTGGKMKGLADIEVVVPHQGAADRIQESHIAIAHIIIQLVEENFGYTDTAR